MASSVFVGYVEELCDVAEIATEQGFSATEVSAIITAYGAIRAASIQTGQMQRHLDDKAKNSMYPYRG